MKDSVKESVAAQESGACVRAACAACAACGVARTTRGMSFRRCLASSSRLGMLFDSVSYAMVWSNWNCDATGMASSGPAVTSPQRRLFDLPSA